MLLSSFTLPMRHVKGRPPMPPTVPRWQFVRETDKMWRWRAVRTVSPPFVTREAAMANAMRCGFEPLGCYWTVTVDEQTTHYRPSKMPIELPIGVQPND